MKLMLKKVDVPNTEKKKPEKTRKKHNSTIIYTIQMIARKGLERGINADLHETHTEEVDIPNMQKRNLRRSERSIILNVFTEFI